MKFIEHLWLVWRRGGNVKLSKAGVGNGDDVVGMKTTDLSCCDLEALPIGANVVPLDQPQGAVMIITDTRTDGTSFYHTAAWMDESGRCSYAEYERSDLSAVKTNGAVAPSFTLAALMAGR